LFYWKGCQIGTINDNFEVALGMSRKWDAREAGREVARDVIQKLKRPPSFFLLFSTIHYEKHGGFEEFLAGVWDVLPKGTPLIGGTVAGFQNNYGCYCHGATALAVYNPHIDVAVGVGYNTKRSPKKAAFSCLKQIKDGLDHSSYSQKCIIDIISGGLVPQMLGIGRKKVLRGMTSVLALYLSSLSLYLLQKGIGREEDVLQVISDKMNDFYILHGSSMDDGKAFSNFQFCNYEVGSNMAVALGFACDAHISLFSTHNLKESVSLPRVKIIRNGVGIRKINNKPALKEFLRILNWPEEYFDEQLFKRTYFYPIGFKKNNQWISRVIAIICGNVMITTNKLEGDEFAVLSFNGKDVLQGVTDTISKHGIERPAFGLISSCAARLQALGIQSFQVHHELYSYFQDHPFILFYSGGEGSKKPHEELYYGNESFHSLVVS